MGCHPDQHLYSALRAQLTVEENFAAVQASAVNTEVGCHPDQHLYSALKVECSSEYFEVGCHPDQHLLSLEGTVDIFW